MAGLLKPILGIIMSYLKMTNLNYSPHVQSLPQAWASLYDLTELVAMFVVAAQLAVERVGPGVYLDTGAQGVAPKLRTKPPPGVTIGVTHDPKRTNVPFIYDQGQRDRLDARMPGISDRRAAPHVRGSRPPSSGEGPRALPSRSDPGRPGGLS